MVRLLVIDVIAAVVALGAWYFLFAAYNRRKGAEAMRWVQSACSGEGRVLDPRWLNSSRLFARLQFPSRSFENARVTMKFRPRALPVHWLLSCWRKQKETLTFEADLGGSPSFYMEWYATAGVHTAAALLRAAATSASGKSMNPDPSCLPRVRTGSRTHRLNSMH
jgi:hypothetical protein